MAKKACLGMKWLRWGTTGVSGHRLRTPVNCQWINSRGLMECTASSIVRTRRLRVNWSQLYRQRPWTTREAGQQAMQMLRCMFIVSIINLWTTVMLSNINHIYPINTRASNGNTARVKAHIAKAKCHGATVGLRELSIQDLHF